MPVSWVAPVLDRFDGSYVGSEAAEASRCETRRVVDDSRAEVATCLRGRQMNCTCTEYRSFSLGPGDDVLLLVSVGEPDADGDPACAVVGVGVVVRCTYVLSLASSLPPAARALRSYGTRKTLTAALGVFTRICSCPTGATLYPGYSGGGGIAAAADEPFRSPSTSEVYIAR